ncbi:unnamed protein product [Alternaria alternata]
MFKSSRELQCYLDETADAKPTHPWRRLFILEDLPLNYVQVLGSHLRIPPSVFGAHWADPAAPSFNHRKPFRRYSENNFVIRYPSTQPIRIDADPAVHGHTFKCDFNIDRHIQCYDPKGPIIDQPKSYHALSFWTSSTRDDGSWDSVLIVDPPIGELVKSLSEDVMLEVDYCSEDYAYSRLHSLDPDFHDFTILPSNPDDWDKGEQRPQHTSMFDDVVTIQQNTPSGTVGPHPLAAKSHVDRWYYLRNFDQGVLGNWQHEVFGFIVDVKFVMGILLTELKENLEALRLYRPGSSDELQWERDGWLSVQDHCGKIIGIADAFLQSYMQFTTMQEAQAANRNASNLAHITNLTMLFIPLSTIAAIFSMDDKFLPGRTKGWIFWVTALPVLIVTFAITTKARACLNQYWKMCTAKQNRVHITNKHKA